MSSMSSVITCLVMEKFFPDTMSDMRPFISYSISLRPIYAKLVSYKPTHNQPYCVPHLRNLAKLINYRQPTAQSICIFVLGCAYLIKILKNVSCEYYRWVVETQLCKLRDTSDYLYMVHVVLHFCNSTRQMVII